MLENNNIRKTDSDCAFGETLVAFLYGEANTEETAEFESHLKNCRECGEELAAFGMLRNAVAEWREIEFVPLPSPKIVLPTDTNTIETAVVEKRSLLQSLREFFTPANFGWQMAAASLAVFVILGLFFINSTGLFKSPVEVVIEPKTHVNSAPEIAAIPEENDPKSTKTIAPEDKTSVGDLVQNDKKRTASNRSNRKSAKQTAVSASRHDNLPKSRIRKNEAEAEDLSLLPVADAEDEAPRLTDLLEEIEPST